MLLVEECEEEAPAEEKNEEMLEEQENLSDAGPEYEFPKFFTPNADGINDYWMIKGPDKDLFSNISIFDRYGQLLDVINPSERGWDGMFNGKQLPESDYWYQAVYKEKLYNGNFSLKR